MRINNLVIDFWQLPNQRLTSSLTADLEKNFYARCPPEKRPIFIHEGSAKETDDQSTTSGSKESHSAEDKEKGDTKVESNSKPPKYDASLVKAIHTTFFWRWWAAGALKFCSGMLTYFYSLLPYNGSPG